MPDSNLENMLKSPKQRKAGFLDFMASAYTSNKALKIGQLSLMAGYSLPGACAISGIFYLGAKTAWNLAKYSVKFAMSPISYLKGEKTREMLSEIKESFKPFGKYIRPHVMPPTLQAITYATGF